MGAKKITSGISKIHVSYLDKIIGSSRSIDLINAGRQLQEICKRIGIKCPKRKRDIVNKLLQPLEVKYKMEKSREQKKRAYDNFFTYFTSELKISSIVNSRSERLGFFNSSSESLILSKDFSRFVKRQNLRRVSPTLSRSISTSIIQ